MRVASPGSPGSWWLMVLARDMAMLWLRAECSSAVRIVRAGRWWAARSLLSVFSSATAMDHSVEVTAGVAGAAAWAAAGASRPASTAIRAMSTVATRPRRERGATTSTVPTSVVVATGELVMAGVRSSGGRVGRYLVL